MRHYDAAKLQKMMDDYSRALEKVGFSAPEQKWLQGLSGEEDILNIVAGLIRFNTELNYTYEHCPDSICITDNDGVTWRVNRAFEETTNISRDDVVGRNIENEEFLKPSVFNMIMKEKRKVSCIQNNDKSPALVTGVPILDDNGDIYKIVTNAKSLDEIKDIIYYVEGAPSEKEESEGTIIAESSAMKHVLTVAGQVAKADSNVLITGESGVGKGVLAKFLHERSSRNQGAFVQINCGAIPEALLESELFGYESGAFTGAGKHGKPGLIELADKGTLFLDEISEIPTVLQVKLLSFLQRRKITRVGGIKEFSVDTRIIAATNKNLMAMVQKGTFRNDLFYRLHVVPIFIPPLRERLEDIHPAARYFARKFSEKYSKYRELDEDFLEALLRFEWPGNLRELENHIERAVVLSGTELSNSWESHHTIEDNDSAMNQMTLAQKLERYEGELVKAAYTKTQNTYKVAKILGISQPSASRKIAKYITISENNPPS